jgi:hypothetical protein
MEVAVRKLVIVALVFAASNLAAQPMSVPTTGVPTPTGDGPFKRIPNARATVKSGTNAPQSSRRVCRGSQPGGWVAVDYVTDTIACPTKHGTSAANGTAVLLNLNAVLVGDEIEVCADQRVPRNFIRLENVDAGGRCASLGSSDRPMVMVIRRSR